MPRYLDVSEHTASTVTSVRSMGRAGIMLHSTEGRDSLDWLQGGSARDGKPASADFLVRRSGDILQLTKSGWYSYHVGIGHWRGIDNGSGSLNMLLVGIEAESFHTDLPRYTDAQIIAIAALCRVLMEYHRLGVTSIVRHQDVARPPGRRSDPVHWPDWIFTKELIASHLRIPQYHFPAALP